MMQMLELSKPSNYLNKHAPWSQGRHPWNKWKIEILVTETETLGKSQIEIFELSNAKSKISKPLKVLISKMEMTENSPWPSR